MAVPSAQTFEVIKDNILRYLKLKDDAEADTLAGLAIRSALVRLAAYPLKGNLATGDVTITTAFVTATLPTDFNMAFSMHFLNTSNENDGRIVYRREEDFDALLPKGSTVGTPRQYCVRGGESVFEFDRKPSSVTIHPKVRLRYFKRYDQYATDSSTLTIAPEFEEFMIWHGRKELASIYDAEKYPLAMQEAGRALRDLVRRDTIRDEQDWV